MNRHMLPDGHPADGPGLFAIAKSNGETIITNVRRLAGTRSAPGRGLINTAAVLLGLLDGGLFAVSLAAQYQYIFHAKHQHGPAIIEAVALDAGMTIFSLLALGLARSGQSARIERALILACSFGSAGMNYAAADVTSPRSVLAYTMPPVFLAVVTDRVIAVVRRHMLGMEAERSAWAVIGRGVLVVAAGAGKAALYGVRLVLAPRSTLSGARSLVLLATPLPGSAAVARALDPVRAALDDDLRELRDRYAMTAANLNDGLHAAQDAFRKETESVREAVRTETATVRDAARTQADNTIRTALGEVRTALGHDLRDLRDMQENTAADLDASLATAQETFRTEIAAVREALRTETDGIRDTFRTEIAAVRDAQAAKAAQEPPAVDRDTVVAELASQIRDAISSGERWTPDYGGLMTRTGYGRSWCEKAVRDARTRVFDAPGREPADQIPAGRQSIAERNLS
jgi:hypothetical protein